jgi:DNA polymerase
MPSHHALPRHAGSASKAYLPLVPSGPSLREAVQRCRACPLGARATQAVWGEGPTGARLMVVGEQPGNEEDLRGRPFVGPAGRVLDTLLARVGIARSDIYLTNVVKHFKWEPRGKRRMHAKPTPDEVDACNAWLMAEIGVVRPRMILCLGATAAQTFLGPSFRVQRDRGKALTSLPWAPWWMATYHPSALLRADEGREELEALVVADLAAARTELDRLVHEA